MMLPQSLFGSSSLSSFIKAGNQLYLLIAYLKDKALNNGTCFLF